MGKENRTIKRKKRPNRFLKLLPYIGIILVAAALIVAVIMITSRKGEREKEQLPSLVELDETQENPDNTKLKLTQEEDSSVIAKLVKRYFDAVSEADVDELMQIVEQDTPYSESSLKSDGEYIEAYRNISCYTIPGIVENTYIVYVYYEIEFIGIDTLAPSLIRLYVCQNQDGSMYIDKRTKDGEIAAYMQQVASMEEIRKLVTDVNSRMQEAKSKDENLRNFVDMLDGKEVQSAKESSTDVRESEKETPEETAVSSSED